MFHFSLSILTCQLRQEWTCCSPILDGRGRFQPVVSQIWFSGWSTGHSLRGQQINSVAMAVSAQPGLRPPAGLLAQPPQHSGHCQTEEGVIPRHSQRSPSAAAPCPSQLDSGYSVPGDPRSGGCVYAPDHPAASLLLGLETRWKCAAILVQKKSSGTNTFSLDGSSHVAVR